MTKTVEGGVVELHGNDKTRTPVVTITFPAIAANVSVPVGANGTMILKDAPPVVGHFDAGNQLNYADSNHNNDSTLQVTANIGPAKYNIQKVA